VARAFAVRCKPMQVLAQVLEMRLVRSPVLGMSPAVAVLCLERRVIGLQRGVLDLEIRIGHLRCDYFFLSVSSNHSRSAAWAFCASASLKPWPAPGSVMKLDLILFSCSAWNIRWLWLMFTVVSASP
jgi:hypothetical protein